MEWVDSTEDLFRHLTMGAFDFWVVHQSSENPHEALDTALLALQAGVKLKPVLLLEDGISGDAANEDLLSWRLRKEPLPSGVAKGCVSFQNDDDEAACLSAYYRLRGWDALGRPEVKA